MQGECHCIEDAATRAKEVVILSIPEEIIHKLQVNDVRTIGRLMGHTTNELASDVGLTQPEITEVTRALRDLGLYLCAGRCCQA